MFLFVVLFPAAIGVSNLVAVSHSISITIYLPLEDFWTRLRADGLVVARNNCRSLGYKAFLSAIKADYPFLALERRLTRESSAETIILKEHES